MCESAVVVATCGKQRGLGCSQGLAFVFLSEFLQRLRLLLAMVACLVSNLCSLVMSNTALEHKWHFHLLTMRPEPAA